MAINWGEVGAGAFAGVQQGEEIAWKSFQASMQRKEQARLERQTAIAEAENARKQQEFDLTGPIRQLVVENQTASMQAGQRRAAARAVTDFSQRFNPNGVDVSLDLMTIGAPGAAPNGAAAAAGAPVARAIEPGQPVPRPAPAAPPAAVRPAPPPVSAPAPAVRTAPAAAGAPPAPAPRSASGIPVIQLRGGGGQGEAGGPPELPTFQANDSRLVHQMIMDIPGLTGSSFARQRELYAKLGGEAVNGPYRGSTQQNLWMRGHIVSNSYQQALQQESGGQGPAAPAPAAAPAEAAAPAAPAPAAVAMPENEFYYPPAPMAGSLAEGLVDLSAAPPGTVPAQEPPAAPDGRAPEIPDSIYRQDLYRGMLDQKRQFEQDQQEWEQQRQQAEQDDFRSRYPEYAMSISVGGLNIDIQSFEEAVQQHYKTLQLAAQTNTILSNTDLLMSAQGYRKVKVSRDGSITYENSEGNQIGMNDNDYRLLDTVQQEYGVEDQQTGRLAGQVPFSVYQMLVSQVGNLPGLVRYELDPITKIPVIGDDGRPRLLFVNGDVMLDVEALAATSARGRQLRENNQRSVTSSISAELGRFRDEQPPDNLLQQLAQRHNTAFPDNEWTKDDILAQWNGMVISTEERRVMDQAKQNAAYQRSVNLAQLRDSIRDENVVQQHDFQRSMQDLRSAGRASGSVVRSRTGRPEVNYDEYYRTRENIEALVGRVDHYANVDERGRWDGTINDQAPIYLQEIWNTPEIQRALIRYTERDGSRHSMATANPGNAVILDEVRTVLARYLPNSLFNAPAGSGRGARGAAAGTSAAASQAALAAMGL